MVSASARGEAHIDFNVDRLSVKGLELVDASIRSIIRLDRRQGDFGWVHVEVVSEHHLAV